MKLIMSAFGLAAVRVSADDVIPLAHALPRDVIEVLGRTYSFATKPNPAAAQAGAQIIFQSGSFTTGDKNFPILQMALVTNGDIVMAANTEIADLVLSDLIDNLNKLFGFRYAEAKAQRRIYQSHLVVEFEKGLGNALISLQRVSALLNEKYGGERFELKRLAFGTGDAVQAMPLASIDQIESSDFVIERRAGEPYSRNRFYCSAPMKTEDHIQALEEIERLATK